VDEEQAWLDQARKGDKVAFGKLIEAYQVPVYNLACRMLDDVGEAEEAAQEAFIRAYTRLHTYNPERKFGTWLFSITTNYCIDLLRKRRVLLLSLDEPLQPHPALWTDIRQAPETQLVMAEQQQLVQAMLQKLRPDYRQVVILRYWQDMPLREIAEMMGTTESAIKSRLYRARRRLAEIGSAQAPADHVPVHPLTDSPPAAEYIHAQAAVLH
jgi:RNA polymerase sigma-70 factor (ECF subfamily)